METTQIEYQGLRRAAKLAACRAGATGTAVDEIADEALARLLLQDGPVNNPKAWVRRTATRLAVDETSRRAAAPEALVDRRLPQQRRSPDELLEQLEPDERRLIVAHRAGYTNREIARRYGHTEEVVRLLLAEATRKLRRSTRRLEETAS